jgi:peptidoglycan/LPS O-acetylase OafA/YrhL
MSADEERIALAEEMPSGFRADIEGLRAVAVIAVLLYHAHLGPTKGGFLGVDVFFVLSGYLITSLLMKDLLVRGGRALPNFWGRRARRLLPASLVVMIATLLASRFFLDPLKQIDTAHDARWASAFILNIKFAFGDSYAAAQTTPTPLLHFWSLAVEEQFYVVWPFLVYLFTKVRRHTRWYAFGVMAALFAESLAAYVWVSRWGHTQAFFLLPTRAWELIAGAMLALVASKLRTLSPTIRASAAWVGVLAVGYSVVAYTDTMNLGLAALLPVMGTAAIVAAAGDGHPNEPSFLLGTRPMVWIGRRSYGIYLWHWPILVLLDAKYGPLPVAARLVALSGAFVLAALSYTVLEHPVRESRWLSLRPRRSLALGGVLVAVGLLAATVVIALPHDLGGDGGVAAAPTLPGARPSSGSEPSATPAPAPAGTGTTAADPSDEGPGNTDPSGTAATTTVPPAAAPESLDTLIAAQRPALDAAATLTRVPSNATPPVAIATGDKPRIYRENCVIKEGSADPGQCVYGDTASTTVVALFGDSHAAQWFPALEQLSLQHHWKLLVYVKSGCPTADVRIRKTYLDQECVVWRRNVAARLAGDQPTLLVMSSTFYDQGGADKNVPQDVAWKRGLTATLDALRPAVQQLLILGDTPLPAHEIPNCLAANPRSVRHCITTRGPAIKQSRLQLETALAATYRADFVATSDWLCGTKECPVVLGNIVMYRDNNHVSATMSRYLAPFVQAAILPLLP